MNAKTIAILNSLVLHAIHVASVSIAYNLGGSFTDSVLHKACESVLKAVVCQNVTAGVAVLPSLIESIIPMIACQLRPISFST